MHAGDIKDIDTDTFNECKNACLYVTGCVSVTWIKKGGNKNTCWMKNYEHEAPKTCSECISAKIGCIKTEGNDF